MANKQTLKCGRGACQSSADIRGYNRVTHMLYCIPCAKMIAESGQDLDLMPLLDMIIPEGGMYRSGMVVEPNTQ